MISNQQQLERVSARQTNHHANIVQYRVESMSFFGEREREIDLHEHLSDGHMLILSFDR